MQGDSLGDRMKALEEWTACMRLLPHGLPYAIRVDGKTFSKWTLGLDRPFDQRLLTHMQETTFAVMKHLLTEAVLAYGQSDEITFLFPPTQPGQSGQFGLKRQKLESITASGFTAYFNMDCPIPGKPPALFDARAICLTSVVEAHNLILWRQQDATRNSIQSAARAVASHNECHGLDTNQLQELLYQKSQINWNDYSTEFKRGWVMRRVVKTLDPASMVDVPPEHRPTAPIQRRVLELDLDMPILSQAPEYIQDLM